MNEFLSRQLREITASVEALGRHLATSLALLLVVLVFLVASFGFFSVALYLWVAQQTRPLYAVLAVAGLQGAVALVCLIAFLAKGRGAKPDTKTRLANAENAAAARSEFSQNVDQTLAPLIAVLHEADMKPEEVALRLGAALTKQVGPLALVALALAAGFMFGRRLTSPKKD